MDHEYNVLLCTVHYMNPAGSTGILDNSGAKIWLSSNRSKKAGTLILGDTSMSLSGGLVESRPKVTSTCPSDCTLKWSAPKITVFNSYPVMDTTGKEIHTNLYDRNGTFIETIDSANFWSQALTRRREFSAPKIIRRENMLSTTCTYDTSKKPGTKFGPGIGEETCLQYLMYYPVQIRNKGDGPEFNCGMRYQASTNTTFSICGLKSSSQLIHNPSFEDKVRISQTFGTNETCKSPFIPRSAAGLCFPANALVQTKSRGVVTMEDLKVGDDVLVGKGKLFSKIFMFTHRTKNILETFISLETELGYAIHLTRGHMLYVNGYLTRAENVKLGDKLLDAEGISSRVVRITSTMKRGLYNPQTEHGDIIVNGIVCSTYTDAVVPSVGHALLSPLRMLKYATANLPSLFKS